MRWQMQTRRTWCARADVGQKSRLLGNDDNGVYFQLSTEVYLKVQESQKR